MQPGSRLPGRISSADVPQPVRPEAMGRDPPAFSLPPRYGLSIPGNEGRGGDRGSVDVTIARIVEGAAGLRPG